jgi:CDP-glucose 4,6-dehydratase
METLGELMFEFYKGKKVFITGHTGFKGSWMCKVLGMFGAEVTGYALEPLSEPNLYGILHIKNTLNSVIGDIRDIDRLRTSIQKAKPEIVIHMAAQAIVRDSYKDPVYTYDTNVMGTVNILEAIRSCNSVKSVINVTTDKVYRNNEWVWAYREDEYLDGYDPYSNSKSCSELVTSSYKKSFFNNEDSPAISTMRAGNVIGGGDYSNDRIIHDCVRAAMDKREIIVRNPHSIRPYQHVLEPVFAYLMVARLQYDDKKLAGCYNIGPDDCDYITTGELADLFCHSWGEGMSWENVSPQNAPHEANILKLDISKLKVATGWHPLWHVKTAIEKTVEWSKAFIHGKHMEEITQQQIKSYIQGKE